MNKYFRNILSIFSLSLLSFAAIGQTTVPNGNFESWDAVGSSSEEPTNWNSNKTGGGNATSAGQTCYRESSNPHSGTYCVRIVSGSTFGVVVNGICNSGKVEAPTFTKSDGYAHDIPGDASYSSPFTGRPDSLVGWYRTDSRGGDAAKVEVLLHVSGAANPESGSYQGNTTPNIIARATFLSPNSSVTGWTRFSVPFTYVDGRTPEYFFGLMTSSADRAGGTAGSQLWVDDLAVIYNPSVATGTVGTGPYYVTATNGAAVSVPFTLAGTINTGNVVTAQLSNASGSFANPINIGTVTSTVSGAVAATIPAGTPAGTGYRIRVTTNNPALTATDNGSNITINLVNTAIAPTTTQTIAANTSGTALTLTETPAANSHVWKYSTTSGGPYSLFNPTQTGATYTPVFANGGTYYIVAASTYPGNIQVLSNQVQVNVVKNQVTPAAGQSLLAGVNGNPLTVTETPTGTSREWKYATTPGGPYQSFSPAETGTSYTPVFQTANTYYVVCESQISGVAATSNEVLIGIGTATINTGTVNGSPFKFSPSAHNAAILVPYTSSGTFSAGNVFTAQLSDSLGSFTNPTTVGTRTATTGGNISAVIQYNTPAGTHYRIRVISSNPPVFGNDNGVDLVIDQYHTSITPDSVQTLLYNSPGTTLTVNESQTSTRVWKYSTTSGGPYVNFTPSNTSTTLTPQFATIGSYYIIAISQNTIGDYYTSNEVQVNVVNGTELHTDVVTPDTFFVSPHAHATLQVHYGYNVIFNAGNIFTAELSDLSGSFATPVVIGSDTSTTSTVINATIPNSTQEGYAYRIRVTSTDPAIVGIINLNDISVIPYAINVTPDSTQNLVINQRGTELKVTETQPSTRQWLVSTISGFNYDPITPPQFDTTYTPWFQQKGNHYVICKSVNAVGDTLNSREVVVLVNDTTGINEVTNAGTVMAWWNTSSFVVDLRAAHLEKPMVEMWNSAGQQVMNKPLEANNVNEVNTILPSGMYLFRVSDGAKSFSAQTMKQ